MTTAQLLGLGFSKASISDRARSGRLHRAFRGVYRVGIPLALPLSNELAAVLVCGPGAALSHLSAAGLWRLPVKAPSVPVHVTVVNGARSRLGIHVSRNRLTQEDVTACRGIVITTPARTFVDIAQSLPLGDLERALAEAQVQGLVDDRQLRAAQARAGSPSSKLALLLAAEHGPQVTRSELERRMLAILRAAGLPEPECNVRVYGHLVDFVWRERLVVETDGWRYHDQPWRFERDHRNTNDLKAHGYEVLRFTWNEVTQESLKVVALVARYLG